MGGGIRRGECGERVFGLLRFGLRRGGGEGGFRNGGDGGGSGGEGLVKGEKGLVEEPPVAVVVDGGGGGGEEKECENGEEETGSRELQMVHFVSVLS